MATSNPAKKILFIKSGSFSETNDSVYKILLTEYPDHTIDIVDASVIRKNKLPFYNLLLNGYFFLREYGADIMLGEKKWRESFFWFFETSYMSIQTSRMIKKLYAAGGYKFTFQTQSLFNGKLNGIPHFIYTDHTTQTNMLYPDINPRQYMRSKRFIRKAETQIYQDATIVFTFGSLISWSLINQYKIPESKVVTAFAGSNVSNTGTENPQKYHSRNVLFVGIDWERKGGPILLKAFEKVLKEFPDATLTIVGCDPGNIQLPNCNIAGRVPVEKVPGYYHLATVFCLPTLREPFGIVFVEAMNYQLPVVANNIGCIPDMVKNDYNGYLIDNDINEYAEAICKLFRDPEKCRQMGENGYHYANSKFRWEIVGKKIKTNIDKRIA